MALLQVGISYKNELSSGVGHMACTLRDSHGATNYESRGSRGCLRGAAARGARNSLFRHQFHLPISEKDAAAIRRYADANIGEPYRWGGVPSAAKRGDGGDCSGFVSGIVCAAKGRATTRLFATSSWASVFSGLGFKPGLSGSTRPNSDRKYPGLLRRGMKGDNVRWVQDRLNHAGNNRHDVLGGRPLAEDGIFGPQTEQVVKVFQRHRGLAADGLVGPKTWAKLNDVK